MMRCGKPRAHPCCVIAPPALVSMRGKGPGPELEKQPQSQASSLIGLQLAARTMRVVLLCSAASPLWSLFSTLL
jgi:hypothetical protein